MTEVAIFRPFSQSIFQGWEGEVGVGGGRDKRDGCFDDILPRLRASAGPPLTSHWPPHSSAPPLSHLCVIVGARLRMCVRARVSKSPGRDVSAWRGLVPHPPISCRPSIFVPFCSLYHQGQEILFRVCRYSHRTPWTCRVRRKHTPAMDILIHLHSSHSLKKKPFS